MCVSGRSNDSCPRAVVRFRPSHQTPSGRWRPSRRWGDCKGPFQLRGPASAVWTREAPFSDPDSHGRAVRRSRRRSSRPRGSAVCPHVSVSFVCGRVRQIARIFSRTSSTVIAFPVAATLSATDSRIHSRNGNCSIASMVGTLTKRKRQLVPSSIPSLSVSSVPRVKYTLQRLVSGWIQ